MENVKYCSLEKLDFELNTFEARHLKCINTILSSYKNLLKNVIREDGIMTQWVK